jgi:heme-degrading monooxygenase HmoA
LKKGAAYAVRTQFLVGTGRASDFEAHRLEMRDALKAAPGFSSEVLLNGLGYPGRYVSISRWDTPDAFAAFYRSAALRDLTGSAYDLYTVERCDEAYEVLLSFGQPPFASGAWSQLVEWNIKAGAAGHFEASRKTLFELRQQHGGIFTSQLFRFLGNSSQYFVMQAYENRAAESAGRTVPEIQAFFAEHPASEYVTRAPVNEYYTIVGAI